jgi:DNA primase
MIPASFISDLLARVDIVDVVGQYVKLRKGGANLIGLCPFHNEKSGSFTVSPTKQFYHCFGCGEHGTAVGFLMNYSGMSFPEAVRDLAQGVGMIVPEERRVEGTPPAPSSSNSSGLGNVMSIACDYYKSQLRQSPRAIGYLKGRGLTGQVAGQFALGYAPDGWTNLEDAFEDYRDTALTDAGLVIDREDEGKRKRYDRFRDRIMFPIRNAKGQVIGFGGRILDTGEPKYLNSPETQLFQKGYELYGLFEARRAIRESGFAIVVEGYMDVVALAQLGVPNAVATLGTACTANHVQKLVRNTDRIVFSFDGDAAGRRAAWRALEASLAYATDDKAFSFLFLPSEHDPDSYVREFGEAEFRVAIDKAVPLSAFLLQEVVADEALETAEGRAHALHQAKPLLARLPAGMLRLQIVRELARLTKTTESEITEHAELVLATPPKRRAPPPVRRSRPTPLEDQVMRLLLAHPPLALEIDSETRALLMAHPLAGLHALIELCEEAGPTATLATLSHSLAALPEAEEFSERITQLLAAPEVDAGGGKEELALASRKLREAVIKRELDTLTRGGSPDLSTSTKILELMQEQRNLRAALDLINRASSPLQKDTPRA